MCPFNRSIQGSVPGFEDVKFCSEDVVCLSSVEPAVSLSLPYFFPSFLFTLSLVKM
ncbi:hypothetical protein L873DRAFT_1813196 [Choiromyces venosus 120613-1]|uniref:Uncharacterized protein n=1 Tax=Choiromyces venosus 120613-1 TaxID=1336337 RepID=A0A3N4JD92_9PEZI|nr:hypothetical protein L873DRAFT_1813196 [Choiromyces venosus 120613-1]